MTHDLDLKVTQVGHDLQTNIYQNEKYQIDLSTCSRDIDI